MKKTFAVALPVRSFTVRRPDVARYSSFLPEMVTEPSTSENGSLAAPAWSRAGGGAAAAARDAATMTSRVRGGMGLTLLDLGREVSILLAASPIGKGRSRHAPGAPAAGSKRKGRRGSSPR